MMVFNRLKTVFTAQLLFLTLAATVIGIRSDQIQGCPPNSSPPGNLSVATNECNLLTLDNNAATQYNLWYKQANSTEGTTLSVVLGVPNLSNWYGMGFNSQKYQMAGTSAIIFWLKPDGSGPVANTYSLSTDALSGVQYNPSALKYTASGSPKVSQVGKMVYLTFEIEKGDPADYQYSNFVIGDGNVPTGGNLSQQGPHQGQISVIVNYVTGAASVAKSDVGSQARTHGILNIVGWGVLLPFGMIVARYGRSFDPQWFYIHGVLQITGFVFVLAGLITGFRVEDKVSGLDVRDHKDLAIFVFVIACIQVSAVLTRPKKEAKVRRFWNWGHWWLGRLALLVAAVNIFVGIHVGSAGNKWKVGYGVVLAIELVLVVILETLLWINYSRQSREVLPRAPSTAMQRQWPSINRATSPHFESSNFYTK